MTSVVFYRWRSAKSMDEIRFNGVSIRLIDLKRAIIDRKGLDKGKGMDFELEVMDESTLKVYTGDDALVPKNSTLVVKRVPAIGAGLLSRLRQQGHRGGAPAASLQPILVQGKQDVAEPPKPATTTTTPAPTATATAPSAPAPAEATAPAPAPAPAPAQEAQVVDELKLIQSLQASDTDRNRQGNRVWTSGEKRSTETSQSHHTRKPMSSTVPPPNYVCHRCGRPGHYIQHCPTNNDPRFNKPPAQKPQQRMLGVPTTAVTKVQDLAEVDTHGKLVFQTSDGYNVVQPSQHNFEHLIKLGGGASSILKDIPDDLKCAFSHKLLQRAVRLPCCGKSVDDESIRSELLNTHYQCPLCGESISPESLTPDLQKRAAVEEFLRQAASAASDDAERAVAETSDLKEPPGAPEGAPRMPFEDDRRPDDYRPSMPFEGDMPLPPMGMPPFFPMGPPPHMGMMPPPPEAMGMPWMDPMMDPMMMGMMGPMGMMHPMGMPPPPFGFPMGPPMSEEEFRRHQAEMRRRGMGPPGPDRRGRPPRDGPPPPRPPRDHDRREPAPPSYGADRRGHDASSASAAGGEAAPPPPPPPGEPPAAADNREARRTDSSRDRPRSRERSRDRGRDRSRDRSRDRGRERRRSRDDRYRDDRDRRRRRDDSRERSRARRSRSRDDSSVRRSSKHSASPAKDVKETTTTTTTETTTTTMPETAPDGSDARERRQQNGAQKHRSRSRSRSRDRRRSDDREAKRSRHERDGDRDHERDRDRNRDRDRERERERDRDREGDRHRERDRDGDSRPRAENGVKTIASSIDRRDRPDDRSRTRAYENDDKNKNRDKDRTREPYNDRSRERTSGSERERERWAMEG